MAKKSNRQVKVEKDNKNQCTTVTESRKRRLTKGPARDPMELAQIDGKVHKTGAKDIYEIMGEKTPSKYGTHDIKEYEKKLNDMNTSDLQRHASTIQVMPTEDRRLMIKKCLKQFQIDSGGTLRPPTVSQKKMSEEALNILAEGK